jgi:hypothetical protein
MNQDLRSFVLAVLDDDHGIKEDAWYRLCDFLQGSGEFELLGELSAQIDSCDGQYFLSIPVDSQDVVTAADSGVGVHTSSRCLGLHCWMG